MHAINDDTTTTDEPMAFVPAWYRGAQDAHHVDSAFDHHRRHPLQDSSLEMLGLAIIGAGIVLGLVGAGLLVWWLA